MILNFNIKTKFIDYYLHSLFNVVVIYPEKLTNFLVWDLKRRNEHEKTYYQKDTQERKRNQVLGSDIEPEIP